MKRSLRMTKGEWHAETYTEEPWKAKNAPSGSGQIGKLSEKVNKKKNKSSVWAMENKSGRERRITSWVEWKGCEKKGNHQEGGKKFGKSLQKDWKYNQFWRKQTSLDMKGDGGAGGRERNKMGRIEREGLWRLYFQGLEGRRTILDVKEKRKWRFVMEDCLNLDERSCVRK